MTAKKRRKGKGRVIVDTCCWSRVFNEGNSEHEKFRAVKDAILQRRRVLIWGGSKYKKELRKSYVFLKLHAEYARAGLGKELSCNAVDEALAEVRKLAKRVCLQDAHLIAIERVGRAGVIVTSDRRCHSSLKRRDLYGRPVPRIYSCGMHAHLVN